MAHGIFIGRFQPLHDGHKAVIKKAASVVDTLHVFIGSANQCRSIRNPFTYIERRANLRSFLYQENLKNVQLHPLNDYRYNDEQWIADLKISVDKVTKSSTEQDKILITHHKTDTGYLNWFPEWKSYSVESGIDIDSTTIREELLSNQSNSDFVTLPKSVREDWLFYEREKKLFSEYPFKETLNFNCSDAVLVCQGKVLLVKRKFAPGANCWALPGGFKLANETFLDCALRELKEETNVRVPTKVLAGSVVKTQLFDSPVRSFGIPRNSLAVLIKIEPNNDGTMPRANGMDDAADTKWVDISDALNSYSLYDDHADIISTMTGVKPIPAIFIK